MSVARIRTVILNAHEADPVVAFWSGLLGVAVRETDPEADIVWLDPDTPGGVNLGIQHVDHPVDGPTQVHVDVAVGDLEVATSTIGDLGGRLVQINRLANGFEWRVVQGPAGHEFCIFRE